MILGSSEICGRDSWADDGGWQGLKIQRSMRNKCLYERSLTIVNLMYMLRDSSRETAVAKEKKKAIKLLWVYQPEL